MPSTATITTFYTFSANTKARATQVNTNFDVFRGHFIPVNADTATASDNTHDLGSDEHRWRTNYVREIDFETSTGTSTLLMRGQTSGSGAFEWMIEGSTVGALNLYGFKKNNTVYYSAGTSGGRYINATTSVWTRDVSFDISITTSFTNAPTKIGFTTHTPALTETSSIVMANNTLSTILIQTALYRDTSTNLIFSTEFYIGTQGTEYYPLSSFDFIDFSPNQGGHTYYFEFFRNTGGTSGANGLYITNVKAYAFEF